MTGITCALFDEAVELIRGLKPEKVNGVICYNGNIEGQAVSVFLTRPGLRKNTSGFVKWIEGHRFSNLIFSGFCGALSENFAPGDVCEINSATSVFTGKTLPAPPINSSNEGTSFRILTVKEPVLNLTDREDLRARFAVELVDMESFLLCDIMNHVIPSIPYRIIKIVGDIPGEDSLMQKEVNMRPYFSTFSRLQKIRIAAKTGKAFFPLYSRKRLLQKALLKAVSSALHEQNTHDHYKRYSETGNPADNQTAARQ